MPDQPGHVLGADAFGELAQFAAGLAFPGDEGRRADVDVTWPVGVLDGECEAQLQGLTAVVTTRGVRSPGSVKLISETSAPVPLAGGTFGNTLPANVVL